MKRALHFAPSLHNQALGCAQMYLDLFERGSAFIDCGEASLSQLALALGPAGLRDALAKLRFVWISHMHADHHVGLAGCACDPAPQSLSPAQAGRSSWWLLHWVPCQACCVRAGPAAHCGGSTCPVPQSWLCSKRARQTSLDWGMAGLFGWIAARCMSASEPTSPWCAACCSGASVPSRAWHATAATELTPLLDDMHEWRCDFEPCTLLCRVLQARCALLGPSAPPLPVIGPHYLPRALGGWGATQLAFHFIDSRQTLGPGQQTGYYTPQVLPL